MLVTCPDKSEGENERSRKKKKKKRTASLVPPIMFLYVQGSRDKCIIHREERGAVHYSDHIHGIELSRGGIARQQEAAVTSVGCNKSGYYSHAYDLAVLSFQHSYNSSVPLT